MSAMDATGSTNERRGSITAIVTCCNSEHVIDGMLASLAAQHRPADQVVVHDAASTDGTLEKVARWSSLLPLTVVANPDRTSVGGSRIAAMAAVEGDLIATLDHDDYLTPDHFAVLEAALPGPGWVASPRAWLWHPGASLALLDEEWVEEFPAPEDQLATLAWRNFVFGSALMYRADHDAAGGYPDRSLVEDWELWIGMACRGVRFVRPTVPTVMYRQGAGRVSTRVAETREAERAMLKRHEGELLEALGSETLENAAARYERRYRWPDTWAALADGEMRTARSLARRHPLSDRRMLATAVLPAPVLRRLLGLGA